MELLSAKNAAIKWGISQRRVVVLCSEGRIPNAQIVGNSWVIPQDATRPNDARKKIEKKEGPRPFLKWAGGKSRIAKEVVKEFPDFNKYYEPFLGSGAVYFEVAPQNGVLNDLNTNLITVYKHIKDQPEIIIQEMDIIQKEYNKLETDEEKEKLYYSLRDEYNKKEKSIRKSALLVFLNKAGWNGMYRENSKGNFNIPFGKRKQLSIYDKDNILKVSKNIQGMNFMSGNYADAVKDAKAGDLIYFDPPYFETFSDYQKQGFTDKNQEELHDLAIELSKKGCYVAISNSNCSKTRNLYKDFKRIIEIPITQTIGSKASSRKVITEVLILNY
ncbi:Dam family site-specific DNA-(adenine-N6)-methyltransferase [Candidatus Saccharibacteria bacterium]|nr:Dam family site-specific DNA-(adenine-N6)-methyltransferase [Candidatus Saccharibacteria bacterium]